MVRTSASSTSDVSHVANRFYTFLLSICLVMNDHDDQVVNKLKERHANFWEQYLSSEWKELREKLEMEQQGQVTDTLSALTAISGWPKAGKQTNLLPGFREGDLDLLLVVLSAVPRTPSTRPDHKRMYDAIRTASKVVQGDTPENNTYWIYWRFALGALLSIPSLELEWRRFHEFRLSLLSPRFERPHANRNSEDVCQSLPVLRKWANIPSILLIWSLDTELASDLRTWMAPEDKTSLERLMIHKLKSQTNYAELALALGSLLWLCTPPTQILPPMSCLDHFTLYLEYSPINVSHTLPYVVGSFLRVMWEGSPSVAHEISKLLGKLMGANRGLNEDPALDQFWKDKFMEDETWKAAISKDDLVLQPPTALESDPKIHNPMKYSGAMETVAPFCEVSQSEICSVQDMPDDKDIIIIPHVAPFCEVSQSEICSVQDMPDDKDIITLPREPSPTISAWQQFWRACLHFICCDK